MTRSKPDRFLVLTAAGVAYPFAVYVWGARLPPVVFALGALALLAGRMAGLRRFGHVPVLLPVGVAAVWVVLAALQPDVMMKAYPVAVSLVVAGVFALTLIHPPSAIERIARWRGGALPPEGVAYTRTVTQVWVGFLLANAAVSAATALWGSLAQWTLWNGLLSYLAMGVLFAGEWLVRRRVRARA